MERGSCSWCSSTSSPQSFIARMTLPSAFPTGRMRVLTPSIPSPMILCWTRYLGCLWKPSLGSLSRGGSPIPERWPRALPGLSLCSLSKRTPGNDRGRSDQAAAPTRTLAAGHVGHSAESHLLTECACRSGRTGYPRNFIARYGSTPARIVIYSRDRELRTADWGEGPGIARPGAETDDTLGHVSI
jgi:hypothetical protein